MHLEPRELDLPRSRIQSREKHVFGHYTGARETVEQGGLASVRVAHEGNHGKPQPLSPSSLQIAVLANDHQLLFQVNDLILQ